MARKPTAWEKVVKQFPELRGIIKPSSPWDVYGNKAVIGSGCGGQVFKANKKNQKDLIVVLKRGRYMSDEELSAPIKELNMLRTCEHPNIVRFIDAHAPDETDENGAWSIWIVMEYCDGKSLKSIYLQTRRPFPEKTIAFVLRDTLRALEFMHGRGLVHRDIKGENILLTKNGTVKLADLGEVGQFAPEQKRNSIVGTSDWMAPEINNRTMGGHDDRCDIWSVGITGIELAELQPPMYWMFASDVTSYRTSRDYKPHKLQCQNMWSPDFHKFLNDTLQQNPENRPSAHALLEYPFFSDPQLSEALTCDLLRQYHERFELLKNAFEKSPEKLDDLLTNAVLTEDLSLSLPSDFSSVGKIKGQLKSEEKVNSQHLTDADGQVRIDKKLFASLDNLFSACKGAAHLNTISRSNEPLIRRLVSRAMGRVPFDDADLKKLCQGFPWKINSIAQWTMPDGNTVSILGTSQGIYYVNLSDKRRKNLARLVKTNCIWLEVFDDIMISLCSGEKPYMYQHNLMRAFRCDKYKLVKDMRDLLKLYVKDGPMFRISKQTALCQRVCMRKDAETGERWIACALPKKLLLLRWDDERHTFLEYKCQRVAELPKPLLTFEMFFLRPDFPMPLICVGAQQARNNWVRLSIIDVNKLHEDAHSSTVEVLSLPNNRELL